MALPSSRAIGKPLQPFAYLPRAGFSRSQGKIVSDPDLSPADLAAWHAFAAAQGEHSAPALKRPPFAALHAAWEQALPRIAQQSGAADIRDDTMRAMLRFHAAGQLKAALFAIAYRESYRPEFEAWKKADPQGVKRWVETFRLGR